MLNGIAQDEGDSLKTRGHQHPPSSQNFGHFYIVSLQACQPFLTERSERKAHSPLVVLAHLPFDEFEPLGRSDHLGGIGVGEPKGFCHLSSRLRGARTEGAQQYRLIEIQIIMLLEILLKIEDGTIEIADATKTKMVHKGKRNEMKCSSRLLLSATLQDELERTNACECGLHKIYAHKDRKKNPILRHIVSQNNTNKHHNASK
jgi:hypothetical protein